MAPAPTPAQIIDIQSARYTAHPGYIDLQVVVENYPGESAPVSIPYTWRVSEDYDNSWNVAAWFAAHPDFVIEPYVAPPPPPPAIPTPKPEAMANLSFADGDVMGIEASAGFAWAMMLDPETCWAFFTEPQPDTAYIVVPPQGVTRGTDFIEINVPPGTTEVSFLVFRAT